MKYHDNSVVICLSSGRDYSLIEGSYRVNDFYITSGQDPKGKVYKGLTNTFGSDGKMSFQVGRKGNSSPASWFKGQVKASQTTFNHNPRDLNFAFLGKLELTIKGGLLGSNVETFEFSDIVIAQGHTVGSNNWWFGGKNCKHIGNNTVSCLGVSASGMTLEFHFRRGENSANYVTFAPIGVANWMSKLDDTVKLGQLMMPASHDAGMSQVRHCMPLLFSETASKTQSLSIGEQLDAGSRYFDIRVDYDHGELVTYHRSGALGCNGQSLKSVFAEAQTFLQENCDEVAIFKMSHIREYGDDHKPAEIKDKINSFINGYANVIYTSTTSDVNLVNITLGETRGKLILAFDYLEHIQPSTGRFLYRDYAPDNQPGPANLMVYDKYSENSSFSKMKTDQVKKWKEFGQGEDKDYCFLLSWTLTLDPPSITHPIGSVEDLAARANYHIVPELSKHIVSGTLSRPNFVYMDFVTPRIMHSIISYNLDGSLPLKSSK